MKAVLVGGEFHNKGSETMIYSTIFSLQDAFPKSTFTVASYPTIPREKQKDPRFQTIRDHAVTKPFQIILAIIYILSPSFLRRYWLKRFHILRVFAEADVIVDISGYALTDSFGISRTILLCLEILLSRLLRIPYILFPQSVSKIRSNFNRFFLSFFLPMTTRIMVRGPISQNNLVELGIHPGRILKASDIAFLFPNPNPESIVELKQKNHIQSRKVVGIIPNTRIYERSCNSDGNTYRDLLIELIEHVVTDFGAEVVLIPHEFHPLSIDDMYVVKDIIQNLPSGIPVTPIQKKHDATALKAIIGGMDLLIASRFHSVIAGLSQSIPTLVIGWSEKYEELMNKFDMSEFALNYEQTSITEAKDKLTELWIKRQEFNEKIQKQLQAKKTSAKIPSQVVYQTLYNRGYFRNIRLDYPIPIETVVQTGLCTSCGTCVGVCNAKAITMIQEQGIYIPRINISLCTHCNLCHEICPGFHVPFEKLNQKVFGFTPSTYVGVIKECYTGSATHKNIRTAGQSGGITTALLTMLLEEGTLDGVVVTEMDPKNPFEPRVFVATTVESLQTATGSKYCPVPLNTLLQSILRLPGKYAFVGVSCQIHGIRKAQEKIPAFHKKIPLVIGLFCDRTLDLQFPTYISTKFLPKKKMEKIKTFLYRSKAWRGWPGDIRIETEEETFDLSRDYRINTKPFFTPPRCFLCFDKLNQLADMSVGDAWLPRFSDSQDGEATIVIRSEEAANIIKRASHRGIVFLQPLKKSELIRSQKPQYKHTPLAAHYRIHYYKEEIFPNYGSMIKISPAGTLCKINALLDLYLVKTKNQLVKLHIFTHIPSFILTLFSKVKALFTNLCSRIGA